MTFEEFCAPATEVIEPMHRSSAEILQRRMRDFVPRRQLTERDGYVFYEGAFHRDAVRDAFTRLEYGPTLILVTPADSQEVCGCNYSRTLYLLPGHHGRGLGTEMLVQLYLHNGPEVWCSRPKVFTPLGYASFKRAYDELVRRGHFSAQGA